MSTQTKLPYKEYSRSDLANAQIIRSNSSRGEEVIKIPLEKVKIRENFNVREDYGDVSGLAQSIMENGQEIPAKVDAIPDAFVTVSCEDKLADGKVSETTVLLRLTVTRALLKIPKPNAAVEIVRA